MKKIFYTGSFLPEGKPGIRGYELDTDSGAVRPTAEYSGIENPTYLYVDRTKRVLYSVSELEGDGGSIAALSIAGDGSLTELDRAEVSGRGATHIAVCRRYAAAAEYYSGDVDIYKLKEDGTFDKRIFSDRHTGKGPVKERQDCPHGHYVGFDPFDKSALWSVDLGNDTVYVYRIDDESARIERVIPIPPGDGPRHLLFSEKHPELVYCVCEITFRVHAIEKESGGIISTVSAIDEGFDGFGGAAAIRFDEDEKHLYVSNRVLDPPVGMDSIACFELDGNGLPHEPAIIKTGYRFPRDMNIFPEYGLMAAAYQLDDLLQIRRLGKDGMPEEILSETKAEAVCCISELI
ncbi:MAG: lactonase family protein [Clostridia bacterium]|nr:lactonase family protein [Clostridia bacterium]